MTKLTKEQKKIFSESRAKLENCTKTDGQARKRMATSYEEGAITTKELTCLLGMTSAHLGVVSTMLQALLLIAEKEAL